MHKSPLHWRGKTIAIVLAISHTHCSSTKESYSLVCWQKTARKKHFIRFLQTCSLKKIIPHCNCIWFIALPKIQPQIWIEAEKWPDRCAEITKYEEKIKRYENNTMLFKEWPQIEKNLFLTICLIVVNVLSGEENFCTKTMMHLFPDDYLTDSAEIYSYRSSSTRQLGPQVSPHNYEWNQSEWWKHGYLL